MAIINIKFTKFDNRPWGFRLAGGSDFPQPLTVIRVTEESLAECMGLKVGDVVIRLNDQPISDLTHGQAHEALTLAGNNFVLNVQRAEDPSKVEEIIPKEGIVPYTISLDTLPPLLPLEEKLLETAKDNEANNNEEEGTSTVEANRKPEEEQAEENTEKPIDENSEIVANKNLTDDEIAQLILEEEELLSEKGLLGVNFKKLRPRVTILKESKVLEALQNEAVADPPLLQERKRTTTFLQKPERPPPTQRKIKDEPEENVEPYRVVIKKQPKKTVTERLLEKGLIQPEDIKTPEERSEKTTPSATPDPLTRTDRESDSRPQSKAEVVEATEVPTEQTEEPPEKVELRSKDPADDKEKESSGTEYPAMSQQVSSPPTFNTERVQELVSTEISLEKQLENVQCQLLALKQLPNEIEKHLRIVSEQLHRIMELSGVQNSNTTKEKETCMKEEADEQCRYNSKQETVQEEDKEKKQEEQQHSESEWDDPSFSVSFADNFPQTIETTQESADESDARELEISVKSDDNEGKRVKKYVVSYESQVLEKKSEIRRSRNPSPALSHGSFEPDPNLAPKDQVIQELQHRTGRKRSKDLWPQAKQLELTYGRRWRCPNDFFNDEMIAEVLQSQAEVIRGKALGVNFKKFEKTALPNYDHLMNSSVFKMIHKMEREPKKGIPTRPSKVNAAEDILERVNSPSLSTMDDRSSIRSVSH